MANLQLIKDIAEQKNIPLATIASELGITPQALSKLMRNNSTKIDTLEKIAKILKVSVCCFFKDDGGIMVGHNLVGNNDKISGDISIGNNMAMELEAMKRELELKNQIIEEKERLIKILMNK